MQRLHQHADQHAQQEDDADHRDQRGDHRRGAELAEHRVGLVLVHRQADVPLHRRQAVDRGEGEDARLAVQLALADRRADARGIARVEVLEVLHHQVLVRVDQDLAVGADQEGVAHAAEVQRVDDLHQGLQAQVAADHAGGGGRRGHGDDQPAGGRVDVRLGERGAAGGPGVLVPGAGARIVVVRHLALRAHGEAAILRAQVAEGEGGGQRALFQEPGGGVGIGFAGDGLCGVFHQQDAPGQPVLDVAGGGLAHLVEVVLEVGTNGVALQVVVVQGEQGEGRGDHQGGGEQDLVAELQVLGHGVLRPLSSGTSLNLLTMYGAPACGLGAPYIVSRVSVLVLDA
ncbi:hypothetical protein FQZ97_766920 [compost metagenome]